MNTVKITYTRALCVALREDAGQAGDAQMVTICDRALDGSARAAREVVRVVREARAHGKAKAR